MTRLMYDAITPARIPTTAPTMVAGYVGGQWPSYGQLAALFPRAVRVSIAVQADEDAQVLDVERLDATPAQSVGWVQRQRAAGRIPTVYGDASIMPAIRAAFADAKVELPLLWVARYDGVAELPVGYVAKQYLTTPGYDVSIVADYWPGVDAPRPVPAPAPLPRPIRTPVEGLDMYMIHRKSDGRVEMHVGNGEFVHIASHPSFDNYVAAGVPCFQLPDAEYDFLRAQVAAAHVVSK